MDISYSEKFTQFLLKHKDDIKRLYEYKLNNSKLKDLLSDSDKDEVFQKSAIILWDKIDRKKLTTLKCGDRDYPVFDNNAVRPLLSFFIEIFYRQAYKYIERKYKGGTNHAQRIKKLIKIIAGDIGMKESDFMELIMGHTEYICPESNGYEIDLDGPVSIKQTNEILEACAEYETSDFTERKIKLVQTMLKEMTPQCRTLLWNHYAKGLSWSEVAGMLEKITTMNSVKISGRRCIKKYYEKYNHLISRIYG